MNLSDEKVIEFQNLYREHFGEEISKKDACEQGIKLLQLISVLYRPKDISARQIELLKNQK
ncbi:MAG: hypothetical protein AAB873_02750 [Patescibacteria group bacterium]|jgi:hypothetical protein